MKLKKSQKLEKKSAKIFVWSYLPEYEKHKKKY